MLAMMMTNLMRLIATIFCALVMAQTASAATLVNDPEYPYSPDQWAQIQGWQDHAHVRVPAGLIIMSNAPCPVSTALACTYQSTQHGSDWDNTAAHTFFQMTKDNVTYDPRFAFYHEEERAFDLHVYTAADQAALNLQFHVMNWNDPNPTVYSLNSDNYGNNISSDAFAECALHTRWSAWWRQPIKMLNGKILKYRDGDEPLGVTPYNFMAGPHHFAAICAIYQSTSYEPWRN